MVTSKTQAVCPCKGDIRTGGNATASLRGSQCEVHFRSDDASILLPPGASAVAGMRRVRPLTKRLHREMSGCIPSALQQNSTIVKDPAFIGERRNLPGYLH
jgi:hypothetical protein